MFAIIAGVLIVVLVALGVAIGMRPQIAARALLTLVALLGFVLVALGAYGWLDDRSLHPSLAMLMGSGAITLALASIGFVLLDKLQRSP